MYRVTGLLRKGYAISRKVGNCRKDKTPLKICLFFVNKIQTFSYPLFVDFKLNRLIPGLSSNRETVTAIKEKRIGCHINQNINVYNFWLSRIFNEKAPIHACSDNFYLRSIIIVAR